MEEDGGPLMFEHFANIRVGSNFSVMFRGNRYTEHGQLYKSHLGKDFHWEYSPRTPVGEERVHVTVVDTGVPGEPLRPNNHFAAKLHRKNNVLDKVNQRTQCFIKTDDHVYRASLSLTAPDLRKFPSIVTLSGEFVRNNYRIFYGALHVYRPNADNPAP